MDMIKIYSKSDSPSYIEKSCGQDDEFDVLLLEKWTNAMNNGIFRYSLNGMITRIVEGDRKYVIQLNLKRGSQRRKPQEINEINLPFNENSFNFTKVPQTEKLFQIIDLDNEIEESSMLVNVSPCENGHSLIVPEINCKCNQVLSYNSLLVSLKVLELSNSKYLRVVFNSLCAYASVNHLHLHTWYLDHPLHTETMKVQSVADNISIQHMHKCKGFVIHRSKGMSLSSFSRQVIRITDYLFDTNVAYNLFISKFFGSLNVYIWPRKHVTGVKITNKEAVFTVAAFELAGHIPVFCETEFEKISEQEIDKKIMLSSLDTKDFSFIIDAILQF